MFILLYHYNSGHTVLRPSSLTLGFSRKKNCIPPVEGNDCFEVDPPGFPVKFTVTPWNFPFFCIYPSRNPCFFLNFWCTPLEFQRLLLYPHGIFHWYPQQGGYNFFSGKAHCFMSYRNILLLLVLQKTKKVNRCLMAVLKRRTKTINDHTKLDTII